MAKRISEYRVRPVTRFVVTHFERQGKSGGGQGCGEFSNREQAERVCRALHKSDPGSTIVAEPAIANKHRVSKEKWAEWSEKGRETFNWLFELMTKDTRLFLHPKSPHPSPVHMKTMAWNAAWLAADAVTDATKT